MKSIKLPSWIERALGFDPIASPPHVFSVSQNELRYGAFHLGPQGYAFDVEKSVELPEETFVNGVLGGPMRDLKGFQKGLETLVADIGTPVPSASLVLPDTWMRLVFSEISELPRNPADRHEILAWKLKRLVPFSVDDLRISAMEVTPFPNQEEPMRLLLGFAIELLMTQLENAFEQAGVQLGNITNTTLALLSSLEHTVAPDELAALVSVFDDSYSLSFFRSGEPLLYRYKAFADGGAYGDSVLRDLRMTISFLGRHFPKTPLHRAFLAAPEELEEQWLGWLQGELDLTPEPLRFEHFELTRGRAGVSWVRTAPLLGAASLEVY